MSIWCEHCRDHFPETHYPNGEHLVGAKYGPYGKLLEDSTRLREVEAERDTLQEWTDRVAQTSTDAATAAEKAEARVAELEEKANNYDKIIKIANEDSLASDGLEMIFAAMREDKEEN